MAENRLPRTYRIAGRVRLQEPLVEIGGISHPQQISWSGAAGFERPVVDFVTFERFERPGLTPAIEVPRRAARKPGHRPAGPRLVPVRTGLRPARP